MNGAIIGLGHGHRVISKAFEIANINLVGVYSKNLKKAQEYSKINKLKKIYQSLDDLINDQDVELVAIAVPAYYQLELIKKCLKNNKKIFCEKPITVNYDYLKRLFYKIKKYNNKLIVDYIFQEHDAFKKFKTLLPKSNFNSSKVKINFITQSFINKNQILNWKNKSNLGGGILNLYLPHILDYLIFFFGKISRCKIIKKNKNFLMLSYSFQNGINALITINSNESNREHSIIYENNKVKLVLKNITKDYAKGFKIIKFNKLDKTKNLVPYNDIVNKFKRDGRIFLTSKLLKNFSKKFIFRDHLEKMTRYLYIESILHKTRKNL